LYLGPILQELPSLKVIVPEKEDCYDIANMLQKTHKEEVVSSSIRDYIESPKKNMYQSYDMIIDGIVLPMQYQIRTEQMDMVNCYGPNFTNTSIRNDQGTDFITRLQQSLIQCKNDEEILKSFVKLSTEKIRVFDLLGNEYQMDPGNTIVDLYYKMNGTDPREITDVRINHTLEDHDQVMITTKNLKLEKTYKK